MTAQQRREQQELSATGEVTSGELYYRITEDGFAAKMARVRICK
jgi:hypothetical protein